MEKAYRFNLQGINEIDWETFETFIEFHNDLVDKHNELQDRVIKLETQVDILANNFVFDHESEYGFLRRIQELERNQGSPAVY